MVSKKRSNKNQQIKAKTKYELKIIREFDAPRELLWKVWTDPIRVMRWWGPKVFTSPYCKIDFRVGGTYLNCMRSPEGKDYWSTGIYREIIPMEKIVCTDSFADENGNIVPASYYEMNSDWPRELFVTITFEEFDGKTKFTLDHVGFPSDTDSELAKQGWNESFDKLADYIRSQPRIEALPNNNEIIITYIFEGPRDLVFKIYTDPNLISQWWGPRRLTTTVEKMEVEPGGEWRYIQRDEEGNEYIFSGVYREIVPTERLVYTFNFEAMPNHESVQTEIFEEYNGGTKLISNVLFQSVEDRDGMLKSGMEEGIMEINDRLNALLKEIQK